MTTSRRDFIKALGATGVSTYGLGAAGLFTLSSRADSLDKDVDVELILRARPRSVPLLEGPSTSMWTFSGEVLKGRSNTLTSFSEGYMGPTLRFRQGDRVRIWFHNEVPESTIVHWHGFDVPEKADGHPRLSIPQGEVYRYDFTVSNRAGLYWYHPHPHGRTGYQVYQGLAGLIVISDTEEEALALPPQERTFEVAIQDRRFDDSNQLVYARSMHDWMMGMMGDQLFINGQRPEPLSVDNGVYRLRLLNGSNARFYNLSWSDGQPLKIIGSDGGLLNAPSERTKVFLGPAERLDVWVDFTHLAPGRSVSLQSAPIIEGRGEAFDLLKFNVTSPSAYQPQLPQTLSPIEILDETKAVNFNDPKIFTLLPVRGVGWTIDGRPYKKNDLTSKEITRLNDIEIWEIDHTQSGMPHPMHIHGSHFQILRRESGGFTGAFDEGWKDTVFLLPGDRVQLIKRFGSHKGRFLFHCHNLEHEDRSMMKDFDII